jgi:hypothetical protein
MLFFYLTTKYHTVRTVPIEKKIKYHTVRTVPLSMKNNKIPHCQNSSNRKIT